MNNILLHLWNQYKIYILTGLCLALLVSNALVASSVPIQSEQARSADSFVDSVGVAVHLSYRDTAYGKYDEIIKPRLQELGVRHIRSDGVRLEDLSTQQKFVDLAKIGIKSTVIMDPRKHNTGSHSVNFVKSILESVEAVEGPNEPGGKPGFPEATRQFQAELYSAIKAAPGTAHLPVLGPSFFALHNAAKLGKVACDIGNTHHYPTGKWGMPLENLNDQLTIGRITCGNKPLIVTESGYFTSVDERNDYGVSEQVAAKYLLRLFLEYFNRGIERFYTYELIDLKPDPRGDKPGWHFGLLRNDGSPKPDFIALKNLISLLQDPEAIVSDSLALKSLEYNLKGNETNVHHTLLQKSNGNFYLVLWQEVPSFEHKTRTDLVVPERPLTLTLNTPISQATTYQPVNSTNPLEQYDNVKQLKLKVPDHPLLIELVPA
jgi:hypothetical protein